MEEFIDIHKKDQYYENKLKKIEKDAELSRTNREIILKYLRDSELGKTVRKGQKRQIGAGRNLQVASFLNNMSKNWFPNTDLDKVTQEQMEKFILNLNKGNILTPKGQPYANETKANIKKFIRKFYKWLLTENKFYPPLVEWIDTSTKISDVPAIPGLKDSIWKVVEMVPDLKKKALIWCCFDSGFRQGEIINCRIKDVEKDETGTYYIYCRESKTTPRRVGLPYSSKLLDMWLELHPHKENPDAQLWMVSRPAFYKTVRRYTKKVLGKPYSVHQIRHTSATFWAPKLDRVNFCKRFGWSYNSKTPDRYIDFAKVSEKQVVEVARRDELSQLREELEEQKIANQQMKEAFSRRDEELEQIKEYFNLKEMKKYFDDMKRKQAN